MDDTHRDEPTPLPDEFPPPTYEEWQAAAVNSLDGKPFDKLITSTYEGFSLQPLYRREDVADLDSAHPVPGRPPYVRGARAAGYLVEPWAVAQELACGSPADFNRALRHDLERGQTAVNILLDGPTRAGRDPDTAQPGEVGRGGLSLATVEDAAVALEGIDPAAELLFVRSGTAALPLLALLAAHLRRGGRDLADLHGCLEDDPLGVLADKGSLPLSLERAYDEMAQLTLWAARHAPRLATMAVHSYPYHNAGANAVQELAFCLATGVAYLRALARRGVDVETAASRVRFDFAVGGDFFMEIAKLRAARLLWSQVIAAFDGSEDAQRLRLHARTARRNKTAVAPYMNMLRATTEALTAAVGGVDSLHVAPFDEPIRPPAGSGPANDFSCRIARNVHVILQEEAHLTKVIDPVGGSYAVEALTDRLARDAWALFQDVEREGGMADALKVGSVQARIATVAEERAANFARRRDVLVGVNQFANPSEGLPVNDETDYDALYRRRLEQLALYRAARPAGHNGALAHLAEAATASQEKVVEAAIEAAMAGATLGEITESLRQHDGVRPAIAPLSPVRVSEWK